MPRRCSTAVILVSVIISVLVRIGFTSTATGRFQVSCTLISNISKGVEAVSAMVINWFRALRVRVVCLS